MAGLGLLAGSVRRFATPLIDTAGTRLKVPHMGWNRVRQSGAHPLWDQIADDSRFYFVHSYYVDTAERDLEAGSAEYPHMRLPARLRETTYSPCSFIRKKARRRA